MKQSAPISMDALQLLAQAARSKGIDFLGETGFFDIMSLQLAEADSPLPNKQTYAKEVLLAEKPFTGRDASAQYGLPQAESIEEVRLPPESLFTVCEKLDDSDWLRQVASLLSRVVSLPEDRGTWQFDVALSVIAYSAQPLIDKQRALLFLLAKTESVGWPKRIFSRLATCYEYFTKASHN